MSGDVTVPVGSSMKKRIIANHVLTTIGDEDNHDGDNDHRDHHDDGGEEYDDNGDDDDFDWRSTGFQPKEAHYR